MKLILASSSKQRREILNNLGLKLKTIYIGGGTPSALSFNALEKLFNDSLNKDDLNPFIASTYGLGVAIKEGILKHHPSKIVVGIGGSASNDGGAGMLEAMGVKFCDKDGNLIFGMCNKKLSSIYTLGTESFKKLINGIEFEVLTDVSNPLLGPTGATYVFSPQKGAKVEDLELLENNNFIDLCRNSSKMHFTRKRKISTSFYLYFITKRKTFTRGICHNTKPFLYFLIFYFPQVQNVFN